MAVSYLLDANTCIDAMKRRPQQAADRLRQLTPDDVAVSVITAAEFWPRRCL